jgi:hypothetical protein
MKAVGYPEAAETLSSGFFSRHRRFFITDGHDVFTQERDAIGIVQTVIVSALAARHAGGFSSGSMQDSM